MSQTTHTQGTETHVFGHQAQIQLLRGEGIGLRDTHRLQRLNGDGVDGALQALGDSGQAGVSGG